MKATEDRPALRAGTAAPAAPVVDSWGRQHVRSLHVALQQLEDQLDVVADAAATIAAVLRHGGRVLVAGNGGSAAQAQHLSSELVGRFATERPAFSAICLAADVAALTALANDYGAGALFARQVEAHGRSGDVLVALSTSGRSPNILAAVGAAHDRGLRTVALTGPLPNPLGATADRCVAVAGCSTATVQEVHQVVVHLLCATVERALGAGTGGAP